MTTPRFPHDFWSQQPDHAPCPGASLPHVSRLRSISGFFDGHLFLDADTQTLRELEAEERTDPLHADGPWRVVADWAPGTGRTPQSLFIPEHYEPKYAYPLLVWLTEEGRPCDLAEVMPDISTRNYFGLAYPLPKMAAAVPQADAAAVLEPLKAAVLDVRRRFHIHSERIYLAGIDRGAAWALELVLQRPEWFGGAVVLGGRVPSLKEALVRFGNLQGKRVLLGSQAAAAADGDLQQAGRMLHSAGVDVQQVFDAGHESGARMLSHVNRWMMDGICATV